MKNKIWTCLIILTIVAVNVSCNSETECKHIDSQVTSKEAQSKDFQSENSEKNVEVCTIVLASAYQILAGSENAVAELQTSARSIAIILFECLLVLMIAQFIGLGLGAAARTLGKKNKKRVVKIVIGVVFAVVSLVPYLLLFHNPLYPMTARHRLKSFADKTITDYPIADKKVYYSLNDSRYMCRVIMSDGQVRVLYLDENGEAKRQ